ncbi:hypothetical protein BG006_008335 [Podila minutissima]|uniref:Uncharacterized protein n=1 Tax=Podila minutissima TaxID=64525 RepID=A0A9P5VQ84_9FUNG|nr:hypothetical protein BG006_008335 [Podila minutissima]
MLPPSPHEPPNVIAHFLYTEYPPWLSLHMLLKRHKAFFTTKVLEELLSPLEPTSPLPPLQDSPQSQGRRGPWKARLSRYLVQRLHLGYYGSRQDLSENTVRYLTARARLEFGYFVIWGRAFWNVSQEDVQDSGRSQLDRESDKRQGRKALRAGEGDVLVKEEGHGGSNNNNNYNYNNSGWTMRNYGASEDTTTATTTTSSRAESAAEEKQRIAQENHLCEEREERLLLLEAARFSARRPGCWKVQEQELADSTFDTGFSFRRVAAARHWRQVALTYFADPEDPEIQGKEASDRYPPSPFLTRLGDDRWMEKIQSLAITIIPLKSPTSTTITTARPMGKASEQENLAKVLDDCRLFQIASGIFDGQATSGRDKSSKQVDEPLTLSTDVLEALIVDFGYMPLPEDDFDRRRHHKGGNRVYLGRGKRFPDDELHCARQKLKHGTIWRYYEIQRLEVMTAYLMYKAPEVLDIMFDRGFQFTIRPRASEHPETEYPDQDLDSKKSSSTLGISPALLLQCCLPRCYSMLRNIQNAPSNGQDTMAPSLVVSKIKRELMGVHGKPKRITFKREDFVEALGGLPCPTLVEFKGNLSILMDLGMEISVVQDRLVELIQISGGVTAGDVEKSALSALLSALTVDWTVGKSCSCAKASSSAGSPFLGLKNSPHPHPLAYSVSSNSGTCGQGSCLTCSGPLSVSPTDLVNRTIQENFELDMDLTDIRDVSWRLMFEETVQNLRLQKWIVNPRVSDWILETFEPIQSSFRTCFDHVVLEALLKISDWNQSQIKRLQVWTQRQEDDVKIKSSKQSKLWKDIKEGLVVERGKNPFGSKRGRKSNHYGGGKHRHNDYYYNNHNNVHSSEDTVMLDIEWTTGQQVSHATQSILASMPRGSDMMRVSDDGHLMLDNGCLDHELLLYDTRPLEEGANGESPEGGSLDSNARVSEYLNRGAVVQEKHLVWLALGLVTESFHGHAAAISKWTRTTGNRASLSPKQSVAKVDTIPVRMACSPEAYQLVWMLVSSFVRQSLNNGDVSPSAINSALSTAASEVSTTLAINSGSLGGDGSFLSITATDTTSPPTSPMPVSQSGCAARMKALQTTVQQRVGHEEARLFVEILSEIEDAVEELLA